MTVPFIRTRINVSTIPLPVRNRMTTTRTSELQEERTIEESSCQNKHDPNKKAAFFTSVASSYDDTVSILSMSITSDGKSSKKSADEVSFQPDQEQNTSDICFDAYLAELEKSPTKKTEMDPPLQTNNRNISSPFYDCLGPVHETTKSIFLRCTASSMNGQTRANYVSRRQSKIPSPFHEWVATQQDKSIFLHHTASSRSDQTRATNASCRLPRDHSPFHERLATQQTKSMSLRRTASSMNGQGRAKYVSRRQSRIPSPFHERLATHHTYAT